MGKTRKSVTIEEENKIPDPQGKSPEEMIAFLEKRIEEDKKLIEKLKLLIPTPKESVNPNSDKNPEDKPEEKEFPPKDD